MDVDGWMWMDGCGWMDGCAPQNSLRYPPLHGCMRVRTNLGGVVLPLRASVCLRVRLTVCHPINMFYIAIALVVIVCVRVCVHVCVRARVCVCACTCGGVRVGSRPNANICTYLYSDD
eukprot:GHVU01105680.1.p2 GENE.GHVU01105680.1~~GHVU01105680.1.p2  ORF type:complete len:118 (-),score=4.75 GHVU01105680.1:29-382(-)